jgi:hypothetical protein
MTFLAIDTETFPIGPDAIAPKMVCYSIAWDDGDGIKSRLVSCDDPRAKEGLRMILEDACLRDHLVFHNAALDLSVICSSYPDLEPLVWDVIEARAAHDTMIREQLLNLSTCGKLDVLELPDGSTQRVNYGLSDLVLKYCGVDISETKKGPDVWRANFDKLAGLRSDQYPAEAARYAREDAEYTMKCFVAQGALVESDDGYASLGTETFHTAVSFCLYQATIAGMAIDSDEFRRLEAWLGQELSSERMGPLFRSGILSPAVPPLPYKRQEIKARDQVAEWLSISPDDVDWSRLDTGLRQALIDCGISFKEGEDPKVRTEELKRRVLAIKLDGGEMDLSRLLILAKERGLAYKKTLKGDVCTDKEVIEEVADQDAPLPGDEMSPLQCFQHRQKLQKMVTTELPRMTWQGVPAESVHFSYKTLVETSRTSSFAGNLFPSANGQNVDPRARPVYVARPGYVLCSADYAAIELVCVAQTTHDLFGHSVHRDKINAGYDLHAFLGSQLALHFSSEFGELVLEAEVDRSESDDVYDLFISSKKTDPEFFKHWRKLAKPVGLGFPGGLGLATMVSTARKEPHFVDIEGIAVEMFRKDPREFEPTRAVMYYAGKLNGMDEGSFQWTRVLLGIALAERLRNVWHSTYPEMRPYFDWIQAQRDERNSQRMLDEWEDESGSLCYPTPMGMHRANCTYTSAANGKAMQSPAAEGLKHAILKLVRAFRDPRAGSILHGNGQLVNEIHDETITELREPMAHDLAMEVKRLMEEGMREIIRDVKVTANPCLMRRWYKEAEPVYDRDGKLTIWEPAAA